MTSFPAGLLEAAEAAVLLSGADPAESLAVARDVLATAERAGAPEPATVALRAMALAFRELGDLRSAEHHLRRAIAFPHAPADRLAQARISLVTVRTERGFPYQALRIAGLARAGLSPLDRAKLDTQRAVALARLGRYREALKVCDRALVILADAPGTADDHKFLAGGLLNRGVVHTYLGQWEPAATDITACLDLATRAGLGHLATVAAANLPFLSVRRGDLPGAFAAYRACEERLFGFPERLATMRADFASALLAAHLPGEARELLRLAVPDLEASGAVVALAEARLKLAQVELLTGDARQALALAEQTRAGLAAGDRGSPLPVLVTEVALRARLALEPPSAALLAELLSCAEELAAASPSVAAALRLTSVELALALGDQGVAEAQLAHLETDRPHLPALLRHHATALHAGLTGDVGRAFQAVLAGLETLGARMEGFDDPSVRAHAMKEGERLASHGLALAMSDPPGNNERLTMSDPPGDSGWAESVLGWVERWRAVISTGRPCAPDLGRARSALGGSALVEFFQHGDDLFAVVLTTERTVLRRLCEATTVAAAVVRLRYGLRRASLGDAPTPSPASTTPAPTRPPAPSHAQPSPHLLSSSPLPPSPHLPVPSPVPPSPHLPATPPVPASSPVPAEDPVVAEAALLERLLFGPLTDLVGERPLVIVPAGALHRVPWAVLPGIHDRPVSVAPSLTTWLSAVDRCSNPVVVTRGATPGASTMTTAFRALLARLRPTDPASTHPARPLPPPADTASSAVLPPSPAQAPSAAIPPPSPADTASAALPLRPDVDTASSAIPPPSPALTAVPLPSPAQSPSAAAPPRPVAGAAGSAVPLGGRDGGGLLVVAAAGPGLLHTRTEVRRVLDLHPRGEEVPARLTEVLDAMERADVVHLAAHGVFHARSPLLSSLTLDDGPLMAYDLLAIRNPPRLVVLSACDGGMAHVPAEGAALGLAGTFLSQGTPCVVAGLVPVPDEEALALMTVFHALVACGHAPATALATASAHTGVRGFACFGAGDRPLAPGPAPLVLDRTGAVQAGTPVGQSG